MREYSASFTDLFDSIALKIAASIIYMICATFYNVFAYQWIMFEKYGSDSMKRSLNNQLTSHLMFNQFVENNIAMPIFIWRVLVGSIHPYIALSVSFIRNMQLLWNVLLITESSVVKSLMIFKWPFMAGLDDIFIGTFLLRINYTLCILSQWFRYWLGSMYEAHEFPILTGIKVRYSVVLSTPSYVTALQLPDVCLTTA